MSANNVELPRYANLKTTGHARTAIREILQAAGAPVSQVVLAHHTSLAQQPLEEAIAELIAEGVIVAPDVSQRVYQLAQ